MNKRALISNNMKRPWNLSASINKRIKDKRNKMTRSLNNLRSNMFNFLPTMKKKQGKLSSRLPTKRSAMERLFLAQNYFQMSSWRITTLTLPGRL